MKETINDVVAKNKDAIDSQEKEKKLEKYEHLDFHESETDNDDEPFKHVKWQASHFGPNADKEIQNMDHILNTNVFVGLSPLNTLQVFQTKFYGLKNPPK